MKKNLKEWIKKNKIMRKAVLVRRYFLEPKFRMWIDNYDDATVLAFHEYGNLYSNRNIYFMDFNDPSMGFFGYWKFIIIGLDFAERYSLVPVVDWSSNSPYYEPNLFGKDSNPFEYYFEPLSDINSKDIAECKSVVKARLAVDATDNFKERISYDFSNQIDRFVEINTKYIHLKPTVDNSVNEEIAKLLDNKSCLGVQIRGVEWGNIVGHPIPPSLDEYFKLIDKRMDEYGYEKIFLATDGEETLRVCRERYGNKLLYFNDTLRSKEGSKTLMLFDSTISRENNKYKMGYEVLRDMICLSKCDGLIAGFSNVSLAARTFKESRIEKYKSFDIVKAQIATTGISSRKAVEKMKKGKY